MQKVEEDQRLKFEQEIADEDKHLVELLKSMIEFNPYMRALPSECIKSPYFDPIRVPQLEMPAP